MRKIVFFLVALNLTALLVACGTTETTSVQSVTPTSPPAEISQPDPTRPKPSAEQPAGPGTTTPEEKPMAEEPTPTVEVRPTETPSETEPTETPAEEMASAEEMTAPADQEEMAPAEMAEMHPQPTEAQLQLLARLPVLGSPAELNNEVWLNSEPLKLANLHGQVVIVEFWTYG